MTEKQYIVRVDTNPPLYFGPFTETQASEASGALQNRYEHETGTYMLLGAVDAPDSEAAAFNDPNWVDCGPCDCGAHTVDQCTCFDD
ncbi:MAG: hypothetical protein EPO08_20570 [Rhodospirillaceae bacterium]|nr:MAG: hypothetical protein EPO08_20570 [Rhodospirillaceae bacterium]